MMNYAQMLVNLHTLLTAGHEFSANTLLGKRMIAYYDEPVNSSQLSTAYAWQFHFSRGWSKNASALLDHLISHCGAAEVSAQISALCAAKGVELL